MIPMLALSYRSPLVGTALGGLVMAALVIGILVLLYRAVMQQMDRTNGIEKDEEKKP